MVAALRVALMLPLARGRLVASRATDPAAQPKIDLNYCCASRGSSIGSSKAYRFAWKVLRTEGRWRTPTNELPGISEDDGRIE